MQRLIIALAALLPLSLSAATLNPTASSQPTCSCCRGATRIEAEPGLAAHLRQGHYALVELTGDWTTQTLDDTWCAWPEDEGCTAIVFSPAGELLEYEVTLDGEVLEGPDWISVRADQAVGPEGNSPWKDGLVGASFFTPLCTPATHDFLRGALVSMSFTGECWETEANGGCDTVKSCTANATLGCKVEWDDVDGFSYSESSACGGALVVQFYCTGGGQKRVRVCN